MTSRLAVVGAVIVAATTLASWASGATADIRMEVISVTPRPPRAAQPFELVARVEFSPAPGSIRCGVWAGGKRFRNIRLVWQSSIARCFLRVPADARGKSLSVALTATLDGSRTRTTLRFNVS
jgi:hypothetical protein